MNGLCLSPFVDSDSVQGVEPDSTWLTNSKLQCIAMISLRVVLVEISIIINILIIENDTGEYILLTVFSEQAI